MKHPVMQSGLAALLAVALLASCADEQPVEPTVEPEATAAAEVTEAPEIPAVTLDITEWEVPWPESRPRDPWVGDASTIWFVGQRSDYLARLNPASGAFHRIDLPEGAGPHTVIADDAGAWYAGNRAAHIGLVDPATDAIVEIPLPGDGRRDVHTMDFDSAGNIWFTVQGGNQIGFMDVATREIELWDVATPGARPYGIVVDDDDQPWIVLFGTHKLATVENGAIREIDLPREATRPRRLAITRDGRIWYVDYAAGYLGVHDPDTGTVSEWQVPGGGGAAPYAMTADSDDRLWFVETGLRPNRFVGFDPATETFTEPVEVPSGGGTVRHMVHDPDGNAIWFGADTNTIGRAVIVAAD